MKTKSKILIEGAFPDKRDLIYGGIVQDCKVLSNYFKLKGINIDELDTTQISNPPPSILVRFLYSIRRLYKLIFLLIKNEYSLSMIFFSSGSSALEKGIHGRIIKFFGVPTIFLPRAGILAKELSKKSFLSFLIRNLLKGNNYIVCQGSDMKFAFKRFSNYKENQLKIINNWATPSKFLEIGAKRIKTEKTSSNKNYINILYVGWLEEQKGVIELLDASIKLIKNGYKIKLNLVGSGNLFRDILQRIKKLNLEESIILSGWVKHEDLQSHYEKADIFVIASYAEGMPNVLIEAMSCGLVPITTPVGSIPDYIKDNINGLFVEPKDINSIYKAIEKIVSHNPLRKKLSIASFLSAKKNFKQSKNLEELEILMREFQ